MKVKVGNIIREVDKLQGAEDFLELLLCLPSERLCEIIEECKGYIKSRDKGCAPYQTNDEIAMQVRCDLQELIKAMSKVEIGGGSDE